MDKQTDECTEGGANRQTSGWMNGLKHVDGRTDMWMDGRIDGHAHGNVNVMFSQG